MMKHYNYISKAPCGQDLFAGKVHEKTAELVATQLLQTKDSLMIGIDGGWGTGKSNLIRMIEEQVSERKSDAVFFTFDAWGHQNDMPRRSILEELTSKITLSKALEEKDKKEWRDKLKTLMSQKREVSIKSVPKVSTGILVLSLVIVLTPAFSIIGEMFPEEWSLWWKFIITTLPFIFGLIYAIYKLCHLDNKSLKSFLNEFISLYQERTKEEKSYEEVFSDEPTSTQFRQWMKELDNHLRAPLILVFDNMDRLPASKVQEFWAAIHAFFAEESYKNIQVIVPFDRSHIISAFKGENCNNDYCYGNDFIDKTFDIVYRVAPPTLSNWKGYLYTQWEKAFGEQLSPEHSITQIYDLLTKSKTPREIVSFINECITTKEASSEVIPSEYIALFVVGKHKIHENPQGELLELSFLSPLSYKYKNEETSKYLSALYYQLSPDEALDIVYADQLRRELESGKSTLLQSLVSQSIFSEILEHAIAEVSQVENATLAFAKVEEVSSIATRFWDQLVLKAPDENKSPKTYQIDLLKHASENSAKQYLEGIVKSIYIQCKEYTNKDGDRTEIFDAHQFYLSINSLESKLAEYDYLTPSLFLSKKETTPEVFVRFVSAAKESYVNYQIHCPIGDIDSYIAKLSVEDLKDMQVVKYIPSDTKRKLLKYKTALKSAINNSNGVTEAETLMSRWVELDIYEKDLMPDSAIENLFDSVKEDSLLYYCLICMRLARGSSYPYSSINSILQKENNTLIVELSKYLHLFVTYGDLLLMHQEMNNYPLYGNLVRHLVSKKMGKLLSIEKVLPQYKKISSSLDIKTIDLLTDWNRWSNHFEKSITYEIILSIPIEFFEETKELKHLQIVSHCREVGKKYLQSAASDEWETHFSNRSYEYQLLISLGCDCPNAYEAFKQTIKTELEEQMLKLSSDTYQNLVSLFEGQKKKWGSVFQKARDRYGEMGLDITVDLFKRYGVSLIHSGKLSENRNAIRAILPTTLLTNAETLSILVKRSNDVAQILNSAEDEYRQEFLDMVLSVYKSNANLRENMKMLASALKIKVLSEDNKD